MRDTMFALDAMMRLGFREQVQTSLAWMLHATRRTHPRLRVFFTLGGEPLAAQHELDWLDGYRGSKPVHLGNQAGPQLQLGNYADLLETAWLYVRDGNLLDDDSGLRLAEVASFLAQIWRNPDAGIWELGDREQYTQSKIACWVTLDRALELAERGQIPGGDSPLWREQREAIREYVDGHCWSDELKAYARMADSDDQLDAAVLLLARSNFCDAKGERFNSTLDTIRSGLAAGGPLLYRYTGMQEKEGAFLACSVWLAEALARARRFDEAAELMDELVALGNDVDLYSEEMDPESQEMLGNFPQALTHLALVNAAAVFENELERERRGD
jgi:GH15 family glucan-1,4-alpha-glucosidase